MKAAPHPEMSVEHYSLHPEHATRMWNAFFGTKYRVVDFVREWTANGGGVVHDRMGNLRIAGFMLAPHEVMKPLMAAYEKNMPLQ